MCTAVVILLAGAETSGCYHYHVDAVQQPVGLSAAQRGERKVLWSWAWGLAQQNFDTSKSCKGLPLKKVTVHSNLGFSLITMASLGLAAPVTVTWVCAKETTPVVADDCEDDPI